MDVLIIGILGILVAAGSVYVYFRWLDRCPDAADQTAYRIKEAIRIGISPNSSKSVRRYLSFQKSESLT